MLHIPGQEYTWNIAADGESALSRPLIETIHGVSLSNYLFVGAGLGFQYYAGKYGEMVSEHIEFKENKTSWGMLAIPLFVNIKGFFPINDDLRPFTTLSFGGSIIACSNANFTDAEDGDYYSYTSEGKMKGGFYCDWGVGAEYKRWSLAIGLQHQRYKYSCVGSDSFGDKWDDVARAYSNSFYLKVGMTF